MNIRANTIGVEGYGVYDVDLKTGSQTCSSGFPEFIVTPGFVDIHIHGAFGIDFMSATTDEMNSLCSRLSGVGYEGFLATTVTASATDLSSAFRRAPANPMILGFHLEGPFISSEYPGAQPEGAISLPEDNAAWREVLGDPRLRIVTLAPEIKGADSLIRSLVSAGKIVSMGHTAATFAQATSGKEAGARHTTHTYNAMRGLHHREAGTVGFALLDQDIFTEIIYDRVHVCREAAELLLRRPEDKVIAVSDSSAATGLPEGTEISMWGQECVVGAKSVRLKKNSALAGSATTLLDAFRNLAEDFGREKAIRLCSANPRKALGLAVPHRVLLQFDLALNLLEIHSISR